MAKTGGEEFPEDSFFRNSNVAFLEAAIQEKKDESNHEENNGTIECTLKCDNFNDNTTQAPQFLTAKQLLLSRGGQIVMKSTDCTTYTKHEKALGCDGEESRSVDNTEKTNVSHKEKSKKSYRPLNITKSFVLPSKHSHISASEVLSDSKVDVVLHPTSNEGGADGNISSFLSTQQKLKLNTWGLPESILKQYAKKGITSMFPWQVECLCCPRVLSGGNLVYSAPTSAGKTLVSEILCIKTVLERRKKALFILPFVSVVREKMFYFQEIFRGSKVRVDGYMGGHSAVGGFRSLDLAVCTIEKANSLVNRLMEENELASLGAVVVDELHLLGDPHRGYLLELLLTKLKYMSLRNDDISIQLVGMSATLPNLSLLSTWLDADLYKTSYRPVPLQEYIKIGTNIYSSDLKLVRTISPEIIIKNDTEDIVYLCLETIADGHSVLIFCSTKSWCESLSQTIASEFRTIGIGRDVNAPDSLAYKLREQLDSHRIAECLEQLRKSPVGLDNLLGKVISFGVSYHHAGLSMDERDIIEGSFRNGTLRVLVATSTLSSGVNLPARRVIIRSPTFHGRPIDILSYRQMVGRAGRMGVDSAGESILITQKTEQRLVANFVCAELKPIQSCLGIGDLSASLKRAILEVIASGVASTPDDLELYTNSTLLATSRKEIEEGTDPVSSCIQFLQESELIRLQTGEDGVLRYSPTPLGQACLSASMHPDEGLRLFQELQRARQCFVLENELHLIYQVTPFSVADQWGNLDWLQVLALWEQLTSDMKRVGELVGVEDRFIVRAMRGTINLKLEKQRQKLMIHRRFYTALALHDLVNEVPLNTVAAKFSCSRGMLQSLQQSAATYAGMVTSFCRRLGWATMELIIEQFQDRLHFGAHRELLDLLRLPSLNGPRARALYNAGITTLSELTTADVLVVENALHSAVPFLSDKGRDGETTSESEQRRKLKAIWVTGKQGLSEREAAELLITEARVIIQVELGLTDVNWELRKQEHSENSSVDSLLGRNSINQSKINCSGNLIDPKQNQCNNDSLKLENLYHKQEVSSKEDVDQKHGVSSEENEEHKHEVSCEETACVNIGVTMDKESKEVQTRDAMTTEADELALSSDNVNESVVNKPKYEELNTGDVTRNNELDSEVKQESHQNLSTSLFNSSINLSTDIFDNNICNISNLSMSIENIPSPKSNATPKVCPVERSDQESRNNLPNNLENYFESFSNSALARLDENVEVFENSDEIDKKCESPKPVSGSQIINDNGLHSHLASFGISNSALGRLCLQEADVEMAQQESENMDLSMKTSFKRLSSDLFASSPIQELASSAINKGIQGKDSEDLFSSFQTPVCDRILRPRNRSGGGSNNKDKQELLSPHLADTSKSPSLFGDSFEINTGLIEVLDGDKDKEESLNSNRKLYSRETELNASVGNSIDAGSKIDSAGPSTSAGTSGVKLKRRSENRRRILGSGKDLKYCLRRKSTENSHDLSEEIDSQVLGKRNCNRNGNRQVGLSRKASVKSCPKKDRASQVLTDSFLEAAFQSAFEIDCKLETTSVKAKASISPVKNERKKKNSSQETDDALTECNKKRVRINESSDEEIITSSLESNINMNVRKSPEVNSPLTAHPKGRDKMKQVESKPEVIVKSNSVIGPPITRRMLALRQSHSKVEENEPQLQVDHPNHCVTKKNEQDSNNFHPKLTEDWSVFSIIDICRDISLFQTFSQEILKPSQFAISLACEQCETSVPAVAIGSKILKTQKSTKQKLKSGTQFTFGECVLAGVAFCFGGTDVYFLSLQADNDPCFVSLSDRLQLLRGIFFCREKSPSQMICCFDLKEHYKMLFRCTGIEMYSLSFWDPKIADWLLEPEGKEKNLSAMVVKYANQAVGLLPHAGHGTSGLGSLALDCHQTLSGRQRSSVEAILCTQIMYAQYQKLKEADLISSYNDVEMPVVICVAKMELAGIGFNCEVVQALQEKLREEMSILEQRAYQLAGRSFCLTSPADTARVLYQELKIGQSKSLKSRPKNTSKETLGKLCPEHPLPSVILTWRKINWIHSKTVCPLLPSEPCSRLFGRYIMHTATGRISMHEPNIQCIPRDFEICAESKELFSMRTAFIASTGNLLVAADYSQLELRLLAYLSGDPKLKEVLNCGQDVFCNLAATWNSIAPELVTDDLRQKAKQLCYGIIYGMGTRALADQLEVDEPEAMALMDTFHEAFPGISEFLSKTVNQCRQLGYVKTLLGRRRYLPGITSSNFHTKGHAERQAVNTTVQGSAADLTKSAMIAVEKHIQKAFPQAMFSPNSPPNEPSISSPQLVLNLHDELMYEVSEKHVDRFCQILKHEMENAISLPIKLPVKVKVGQSWGTLDLK